MNKRMLRALVGFILVYTASLVAQTNVTAPQPIPEGARRHFVMGETIFKEAKSAANFSQAAAEFTEAAKLAPQWPEARYDLALAKEAAGDYPGAMADLKLYQQFKLTEAEARTVQDKIYAIEAKQKMAAEEANSPTVQLEKLIQSLDGGVWRCVGSSRVDEFGHHYVDVDAGHTYIAVSGRLISGYQFIHGLIVNGNATPNLVQDVPYDPSATPRWTVTLTSRKFINRRLHDMSYIARYSDVVTISDDGRSIAEEELITISDQNGSRTATITRTYVRN